MHRNVWVMSGTILATVTCIFTWYRVLPNHLRALGATDAQAGLVFMGLTMAHRIPQILSGLLADRMGRKRIFVWATFLMAPMYAATAFMTTWTGVLVTLGICWLVGSLQGPSIPMLVAEAVPEERRGKAIGTVETAAMVAVMLGPLLGAQAIRLLGDFRTSTTVLLLVTAGVYLAVGVVRGLFLVETHAPREAHHLRDARFGPFVPVALLAVLVWAVWFLSTDGPFFALYGKDVMGLDEPGINTAAFLGGLAALAMAIVGGEITDRVGTGRVMVGSLAAALLFLLPFAWAWAAHAPLARRLPGSDYLLYVLLFPTSELFVIAFQKYVTTNAPKEHRALHWGMAMTAVGLFGSLASGIGGRLYGAQGPSAPFALGAACAALGMLLALTLWWKTRRPAVRAAQA